MIHKKKQDQRLVNDGTWNRMQVSPCGTDWHFPTVQQFTVDKKVFCRSCGEYHPLEEYRDGAVKWVGTASWLNPFTRRSGYYESKIKEKE